MCLPFGACLLMGFAAPGARAEPSPAQERAAAAPVRLTSVADGVWAAVQPVEGRFDDANTLVVRGDDGLLVVDAQADRGFVAGVIDGVAALDAGPVAWLVNTHWHADHTQGNAAWRAAWPELAIHGHASLLEDVPGRAEAELRARLGRLRTALPEAQVALDAGVDPEEGHALDASQRAELQAAIERTQAWVARHEDVVFVPPTATHDAPRTLDLGGRSVQLIPVVAHTRGDTLVWLPEARVLATGDVLDDLPYIGHGHPAAWLQALDRIEALQPAVVVPGHGAVWRGDVLATHLQAVRAYLIALVETARAGVASGATRDQQWEPFSEQLPVLRAALVTDAASARFFDATVEEAFDRAWEEAGQPQETEQPQEAER